MKGKKIIIPGGTGFIGQELANYFGKENEIVVLGRQSGDTHKNSYRQDLLNASDGYNLRYVKWNGKNAEPAWASEIEGADIIINLAGKSVNCRYHRKQKEEILGSRTHPVEAIGEAIRRAARPPRLWINMASATIYQDSRDRPNDELTGMISDFKKDNMPYNLIDHLRYSKNRFLQRIRYGTGSEEYRNLELDFSVQVCKQWEKVFFGQETPSTEKIALRTAITLGKGGVITPYLALSKFGLGGKQGTGKQMYSWVHIEDVARMIEWLFENDKKEGIYNCAAPNPVSNSSFMKSLRCVTGNKIGLPATTWLLEAGAFLIGTESELLMKSRWVIPAKALQEGFTFKYPVLEDALQQIIGELPKRDYRLV